VTNVGRVIGHVALLVRKVSVPLAPAAEPTMMEATEGNKMDPRRERAWSLSPSSTCLGFMGWKLGEPKANEPDKFMKVTGPTKYVPEGPDAHHPEQDKGRKTLGRPL
jgi:hypothetical protein